MGLGNIWKVPALTGQHGGASFLLIYVLSTLVVALPLMIVEMIMGRRTRANAYKTFVMLTPSRSGLSGMSGASARIWRITGGLSVLAAALILAFYSDVAGWVFAYVPKAVSGGVATTDPQAAARIFGDLLANPWESLLWQWLVLGCIAAVIMRGASAGIERVTRVLIPLLFLLLVAVCIRSLTLPNAQAGLRFLFMPDFARIDGNVVLMAMGLSFFKMSIGFGCMITYGSYFQADTHVPALALRVMVCDLLVSLLAGVAVFPAVFSFGFEPTAGTSLLFLTIPAVFASMPGGQFFTAFFSCSRLWPPPEPCSACWKFPWPGCWKPANCPVPEHPAGDPGRGRAGRSAHTLHGNLVVVDGFRPLLFRRLRLRHLQSAFAGLRPADQPVRRLCLAGTGIRRRPGQQRQSVPAGTGAAAAPGLPHADAPADRHHPAARAEGFLRGPVLPAMDFSFTKARRAPNIFAHEVV